MPHSRVRTGTQAVEDNGGSAAVTDVLTLAATSTSTAETISAPRPSARRHVGCRRQRQAAVTYVLSLETASTSTAVQDAEASERLALEGVNGDRW